MEVKRGDIVWLNPNLHINLGKNVQSTKRPYVVISNNKNNKLCPTVNVACLSKKYSKAFYPMHVLLDKEKYNLKYNSIIFCEQVLTVNKNQIINKICSLDDEDLQRLNEAIYIQIIDEDKKGLSN